MNADFVIAGIGIWMPGCTSWPALVDAAARDYTGIDDTWTPPAPDSIPGRERRRAPLLVKLAVEVMHQACTAAAVDQQTVASVFASSMGDSEITDYMCRTLAGDERVLSPTRFHNSVNNAASGYWSISTGNRAPSTFVSGFRESFPVGLLEAALTCVSERRPVVLAVYDIATQLPLSDPCPIGYPYACALVVQDAATSSGPVMHLEHHRRAADDARAPAPSFVEQHAGDNPSAASLRVLDALARNNEDTFHLATGAETCLSVTMRSQ